MIETGLDQQTTVAYVATMTVARATRLNLAWLILPALQLGVWALLAPRSFYDSFPGFGWTWVSVDGPYNEHLVRDVGALNLALAVLLIAAFVRLSRDLVVVAAAASLVWGVPHLIYHIANRAGLDTVSYLASIGGLALSVIVAVLLIVSSKNLNAAEDR